MTQLFEVLDILSWISLVAGAIFCVIGGVGLHRLPDFYCRTHGASITDTMGAGLVLFGLILQSVELMVSAEGAWLPDGWLVCVKLIFIVFFILLTSPTSGHALVKAAYADGLTWTNKEGVEHADSE